MSSTAPNQAFALVDCNNFYASCESVFNPALRNQPVVVLSSNDGCIIARSKEAKALGVPMGAPAFQCKDLFLQHKVITCSSNFALYGDMSQRVMQTLSQFSPDLEIYSVDEAFLKIENKGASNYAQTIRNTVLKWTGLTVSIGIAPTKTLAKAANAWAKKREGVFNLLDPRDQKKILDQMSVGEIWGIGRRLTQHLARFGIRTAWEFCQADDCWIKKHLSVVGLRTAWELRGISCLELDEAEPSKKSIMSSKSFGKPQTDFNAIAEALASYTSRAAEKMREQSSAASSMEVFLITHFKPEEPAKTVYTQIILPQPTDYAPDLIYFAKRGLETLFRKGQIYRKTGILLGGLVPNQSCQLDFFNGGKAVNKKHQQVMEVVDQANHLFGRRVLRFAAEGTKQEWKTRLSMRSPRYTTSWNELLKVTC